MDLCGWMYFFVLCRLEGKVDGFEDKFYES